MIKYFYFERQRTDDGFITINEKILDEKPDDTEFDYDLDEFSKEMEDGIFKHYIDVEEIIKLFGKLNELEQEIYDRLLLQERNKKLDTL